MKIKKRNHCWFSNDLAWGPSTQHPRPKAHALGPTLFPLSLFAILAGPLEEQDHNRRKLPMRLISLALTCAAIALAAVACTETTEPTNRSTPTVAAPPAPSASIDEFAEARVNYAKNCEACHGDNAEGGLVKVEGKQIKVPSLKAAHAIKHTDEQLTKMITNGEEAMPSFKDKLTPEQISELVRFVRKEFQGKN